MSEDSEATALETVTSRFLAERLSPLWKRLGSLSTGAVGSAVVVVASTEVVRRLIRLRRRRHLGLWGVLALMPIVARMLAGSKTRGGTEAGDDTQTGKPTRSAARNREVASGDEE